MVDGGRVHAEGEAQGRSPGGVIGASEDDMTGMLSSFAAQFAQYASSGSARAPGAGNGNTPPAVGAPAAVTPASSAPPSPPQALEDLIVSVARTGSTYHPWSLLRELFGAKALAVVNAAATELQAADMAVIEARREAIVGAIRGYEEAPFTLQRLAEVLLEPRKQYSSTTKLLNALEKLVTVSTTIPPLQMPPPPPLPPPPTSPSSSSPSSSSAAATHQKPVKTTGLLPGAELAAAAAVAATAVVAQSAKFGNKEISVPQDASSESSSGASRDDGDSNDMEVDDQMAI